MEMLSRVVSMFKKKEPVKMRSDYNKLMLFLLGTIDPKSPVKLLRGQSDILRIIWIYACSEWWSLHFHKYKYPVIRENYRIVSQPTRKIDANTIVDLREYRGLKKTSLMDCPAAVIATNISFPPLSAVEICVNMMPFDLFAPERTLPEFLHGYIGLIKECRKYQKQSDDEVNSCIAYVTVDERPFEIGQPHRRGGVHVESPGALRSKEIADKSQYTPDLSFYHRWGMGEVDGEYLMGGIYLASNLANTTAIWNCRVHDTFGDIIAPHGSLERCRDVLGPATRTLQAGELVWISDRTPHESLPIDTTAATATSTSRRQFFRLVVGEISYWFPEHNTSNPLGYTVPANVKVIEGNKFQMTQHVVPIVWECGSRDELATARKEVAFREFLYSENLGFLIDALQLMGIHSQKELLGKWQKLTFDLAKTLTETGQYSPYTIQFITDSIFRISG